MQDAVPLGGKQRSWPLTVRDPTVPWSEKAYPVFGDLPKAWILVGTGWFPYRPPVWEKIPQDISALCSEKSTPSAVSHKFHVVPSPKVDQAVSIYVVQGQGWLAGKGKQPTCRKTVFSHTAFVTFLCQKRNRPPGLKQIGPIYAPSTHKATVRCLKALGCWRKGLYYFGEQGFGEEIIIRM